MIKYLDTLWLDLAHTNLIAACAVLVGFVSGVLAVVAVAVKIAVAFFASSWVVVLMGVVPILAYILDPRDFIARRKARAAGDILKGC